MSIKQVIYDHDFKNSVDACTCTLHNFTSIIYKIIKQRNVAI